MNIHTQGYDNMILYGARNADLILARCLCADKLPADGIAISCRSMESFAINPDIMNDHIPEQYSKLTITITEIHS